MSGGRDGFHFVENNVPKTEQKELQRELPPLTNLPVMLSPTIQAPELPHTHFLRIITWRRTYVSSVDIRPQGPPPPAPMLTEGRALNSPWSKRHIVGAIPPKRGSPFSAFPTGCTDSVTRS